MGIYRLFRNRDLPGTPQYQPGIVHVINAHPKSPQAFSHRQGVVGLERVEARVFYGNPESERVLERAGFTKEGVLRSLPRRAGGRDDMILYSLLLGE